MEDSTRTLDLRARAAARDGANIARRKLGFPELDVIDTAQDEVDETSSRFAKLLNKPAPAKRARPAGSSRAVLAAPQIDRTEVASGAAWARRTLGVRRGERT